jgi:hypothetical protein
MGIFMSGQLIAAVFGVVVGAVAAWLKAVLAIREKANEELRSLRIAAYPAAYQLTAPFSLWPRAIMTYDDLFQLNLALRRWYFNDGGLYLSARSRDYYGNMKQLICAHLDEAADRASPRAVELPADAYADLMTTARAFRNALADDLETRRQRSLWWVSASWLRHRRHHQKWTDLMARVGGVDREVRPYPLSKMPLRLTQQAQTTSGGSGGSGGSARSRS